MKNDEGTGLCLSCAHSCNSYIDRTCVRCENGYIYAEAMREQECDGYEQADEETIEERRECGFKMY